MLFEKTTQSIYLFGEVDYNSCKNVIQEIDTANRDENIKNILLIICSTGGALIPAFALCDHMALSKKPIDCLAEGWCGSAAVAILQKGRKRIATKNTVFKLHSSSHKSENLAHEELVRFTEEAVRKYNHFVDLTIHRPQATKEEFESLCLPVGYFSVEEALKFGKNGLIDEVLE